MSKVIGYFGDNAGQVDAKQAESKLRAPQDQGGYPKLLQGNETVIMAFVGRAGKGRDSMYFTTKRLVMVDKSGITGSKQTFMSIVNERIQAFSLETGGTMDSDAQLTLYVEGMKTIKLDFCKGIDVYALQTHLSHVVFTRDSRGAAVPNVDQGESKGSFGSGVFHWFGDDNTQIDAKKVEGQLKEKQVLLPEESVELAFKCGRDSFLLSSHRLLKIDVQGMSGKKAEYLSITWSAVRAFSVETAGNWDNDSELLLYTNLEGMTRIPMDFKKRKADIFAVQRFISDKLLGMDTVDPSQNADTHRGSLLASFGNMFSWAGDDSRMIDAAKMDKQYHSNPPILQKCESTLR